MSETRLSPGDQHRREIIFSQKDVDDFIALSGDRNIIHLELEAAANSRIGRLAIPGVLAESKISGIHGTQFPGHGTVYRSKKITFRRPLIVGVPYVIVSEVALAARWRLKPRYQEEGLLGTEFLFRTIGAIDSNRRDGRIRGHPIS